MPIVSGPSPPTDPRTETPSPSAFGFDPEQQEYREYLQKQNRALEVEEESAGAQQKLREQDIAERGRRRGDIEGAMADERAYAAKYPGQQKPPEPPNPEDYQKMSWAYLAAMVAVGAFAGKAVRNVSNAPLSAFGAAAKGWNEGNQQAYKNASAQWEQANRRVQEINRQQLEKYRAVLDNKRLTIDEMMQQYKMVAVENQDRIGYEAAKSENFDKIAQHYAARMKTTEQLELHSQKIIDTMTQQNENAAANAEQIRGYLATPQGQQWFSQFSPAQQLQINGFVDTWAPPQPRAEATFADVERPGVAPRGPAGAASTNLPPDLRGPQPLNMKPADMAARQFRIESYRKGKGEPSPADWANFNRQQHPGRSIVAMELEAERDRREAAGEPPMTREDEVQFEAERRYGLSAMGAAGGQAGKMATGIAALHQALPQASQASSAVGPRTKWVPYNRLKQDAALMASNPVYQNFVIANETVITDYAFAIGRGGGMTVHAQERAAKLLNPAQSDAAYQSGLRQLEREANAIANAPAEAKAALLHQLFPNAPPAAIEEATATSVLPPAPAQQRPVAPDEGWGSLRVQ